MVKRPGLQLLAIFSAQRMTVYVSPLFCSHGTSRRFLGGVLGFIIEHPGFGAPGTFTFLAPDFFNFGALGGHKAIFTFFNLVEQQSARDVAIQTLLAGFLALHSHAGRTVGEHDAGGNFVHVLPAMPAGADERFLDIGFAHAQCRHALRELCGLFKADRKCAHGVKAGRCKVPLISSSSCW